MKPPLFYPRAQIIGVIRWPCVWCGKINEHRLTPYAFKLYCTGKDCGRVLVHGSVFHTVYGKTDTCRDRIIPTWAAEHEYYTFDPIPEAIWSGQAVKRYGRSHLLVLYDNILQLPESPAESPSQLDVQLVE